MQTVLVVEDEEAIGTTLRETLESMGFAVPCVATSGEEALARMNVARPDLVLMDVRIDGRLDGIQTAQIVRDRYQTPVVFMTSHADRATVNRAKATQPYGYLIKPFREEELRSTIDVALHKHAVDARLASADRMASLGTLAAGIAHEINNPLQYILLNLESAVDALPMIVQGLASGTAAPEAAVDRLKHALGELQVAREGIDRVQNIVRDLNVFAQVPDERRSAIDVRDVIESTLRLAANDLRHRAQLVKDLRDVPRVGGSVSRFAQVMLNLLVNATQSMPMGHADEHEIRVSTATDAAGRAVIEVRDTGAGIRPEHLPHVLEPFFTTKGVGPGTGLGLSVCLGIVSSMGGTIDVQSEFGHGTLFRITLPPTTAAARLITSPTPAATVAEAVTRGRVLVIDDEQAVCVSMRRILERDHDVTTATSAAEALARLRKGERFDVLLCDMMMPAMTGVALHAALAADGRGDERRMVFMTGGVFTVDAQAFLERVAPEYLLKPFTLDAVRALIARALERTRASRG